MDIAALSIGLNQMKAAQEVGVSVLKKAMDSAEGQGTDLVRMLEVNTKMLEQSISPHVGGNVDILI